MNMRLVILTLCLSFTTCNKRHVANSVEPACEDPPIYDVSNWVNKLHLQRCAFVEIGQGHCAVYTDLYLSNCFSQTNKNSIFQLFVESVEKSPHILEYFLGICEKEVIMKWSLCSTVLENLRPDDCTFNNDTVPEGVRVHRRLCDISNLAYYGAPCGCNSPLADRMKYKVNGKQCFELSNTF